MRGDLNKWGRVGIKLVTYAEENLGKSKILYGTVIDSRESKIFFRKVIIIYYAIQL